jgi:chemotaxis protein methyltransferase CheR
MVYFETAVKRRVLARVREIMCPDGYLFLGGAESALLLDEAFARVESVRSSCYQLRPPRSDVPRQM